MESLGIHIAWTIIHLSRNHSVSRWISGMWAGRLFTEASPPVTSFVIRWKHRIAAYQRQVEEEILQTVQCKLWLLILEIVFQMHPHPKQVWCWPFGPRICQATHHASQMVTIEVLKILFSFLNRAQFIFVMIDPFLKWQINIWNKCNLFYCLRPEHCTCTLCYLKWSMSMSSRLQSWWISVHSLFDKFIETLCRLLESKNLANVFHCKTAGLAGTVLQANNHKTILLCCRPLQPLRHLLKTCNTC